MYDVRGGELMGHVCVIVKVMCVCVYFLLPQGMPGLATYRAMWG